MKAEKLEICSKIERIQVADIKPDDLVILHVAEMTYEEVGLLTQEWERATGLPNRVVVVTGGLEVEVKRPA